MHLVRRAAASVARPLRPSATATCHLRLASSAAPDQAAAVPAQAATAPPTTAELHRAALAANRGQRPEQAKANAADNAAATSRRADIDRSRYGSSRADVAATEAAEDISAGRSRTYVREDGIAEQTATTLPEILRMDLHRRQNLPLLRSEIKVKRTGSGLNHAPEIRDVWLTQDGEKPKSERTEKQRQRDKHIVPQHRKYLTHGRVSAGGHSPYKRQQLDDARRANVARQRITERERSAAGIEEEERPTDSGGYQELVEKKIQAGIGQGMFDTKVLKYAGVDLLAASRGQGDMEVQRVLRIAI